MSTTHRETVKTFVRRAWVEGLGDDLRRLALSKAEERVLQGVVLRNQLDLDQGSPEARIGSVTVQGALGITHCHACTLLRRLHLKGYLARTRDKDGYLYQLAEELSI